MVPSDKSACGSQPNDFGVLDHDVVLPTGAVVHNAMRVVANESGSTVIFTLLRLPGVSENKFAEDAQWVEKDLTTLKGLLEQSHNPATPRSADERETP